MLEIPEPRHAQVYALGSFLSKFLEFGKIVSKKRGFHICSVKWNGDNAVFFPCVCLSAFRIEDGYWTPKSRNVELCITVVRHGRTCALAPDYIHRCLISCMNQMGVCRARL